jgi:hypothetical protein
MEKFIKNSAEKNEIIGGTIINVEITPIEKGNRLDTFIKKVYVIPEYEDLPKNKRRTNILKHIVKTIISCLPSTIPILEARFTINNINYLFKKENEIVNAYYVTSSSRKTHISIDLT